MLVLIFFLSFIVTSIVTSIIIKLYYKRKEELYKMPKMQLYPLYTPASKDAFLERVLEHKYIYLFEEINQNGNFQIITTEKCQEIILKKENIAISIKSTNLNYSFIINQYCSNQNNKMHFVNNPIVAEDSVCIIIPLKYIPKSLDGSFKKHTISYEISTYDCAQIYPKYKNYNKTERK